MRGSLKDYVTERELAIWRLVAQGKANKMIADEIGINIKTVDKHRTAVFRKLGVHSVADVTRLAIERCVVPVALSPLSCVIVGKHKRFYL